MRFVMTSLILAVSSSAFANGLVCKDVFSPKSNLDFQYQLQTEARSEAWGVLETVEGYERTIQARKQMNGNTVRMTETETDLRFDQLQTLMAYAVKMPAQRSSVYVNNAIDLYRQVFRDVELSQVIITNGEKDLSVLRRDMESGRVSLEKGIHLLDVKQSEIDGAYLRFGRAYGEYLAVRAYLEPLAAQETAEGAVAKRIFMVLGARSLHNLIPNFNVPLERPSVDAIKETFRKTPELILIKLRADSQREGKSMFIRLSNTLAKQVVQILRASMPKRAVEPVSNLIGLSSDAKAFDQFMGTVKRLSDPALSPKEQLTELMKACAGGECQDLLITFARTFEKREAWAAIKAEAELEGKTLAQSKWFFDRMVKAEKQAEPLAPMSLSVRPSGNSKLGVVLASGGVLLSISSSHWAPPVLNALHQALTVMGLH